MKAYLERATEHDEFMKMQKHEFEMGKRHLANMMGEAPEVYDSQEKIDVSLLQRKSFSNNQMFSSFRKLFDISSHPTSTIKEPSL